MKQVNHHHRKCRGFALIATISVMVLLVMIALAMLSLSTIELRASRSNQAMMEAQSNARLALMMAIGELQKQLGPDSRISAPHDAGTGAAGGQPHWAAVYDAWQEPASGQAITPGSRNPSFRAWLVSGASSGVVTPGETVALLDSGTLGDDADADAMVRVPMVRLADKEDNGRMAWWISDESTKAKVSAGSNAALAANRSPLLNAQSSPYVGHKAFAELADFEWDSTKRAVTLSLPQLDLATAQAPGSLGLRFHDVTLHSMGVLADVRQGRLKRDLSSLFARNVEELEDMPLYVADGRLNRFQITEDGSLSNSADIPANSTGANRWGINLEELHLFHNLHREVDWSQGSPRLVNKDTKEQMAEDRFYIYRKPSLEAVHMILSFRAVPDEEPDKYKMQGMLDGMLTFSNPNDIPLEWQSSMKLSVDLHSLPYHVKWNIRRADGSAKNTLKSPTMNTPFFRCNIRDGFTLEAGEAAVFGNSFADTRARESNLTRGFIPRGGVAIDESDWQNSRYGVQGLRAGNLDRTDRVDFTMMKTSSASFGNVSSGFIQCPLKIGNSSGGTWKVGEAKLTGGGGSTLISRLMDQYMLREIEPQQALDVSVFVDQPMPVMMMTFLPNVERSRNIEPPNAFASRPFQMIEPAVVDRIINTQSLEADLHTTQWLVITDPMNYEFGNDRTLAAGEGGRSLYHGGAREVGLGGQFNVLKRRIPLTAPLSIGAFENAIACGLRQRFENLYQVPAGRALTGNGAASPAIAKAIGNSWANPFLPSDTVYDGDSDVSWMVNNALWDQWFLSSLVDGRGAGSSAWVNDSRSARQQFKELAEGTGSLRNSRLVYHRHKPMDAALDELFDGEGFKTAAFNNLAKYLLIDGAFNVNSTSEKAWKAFLSSVRDQELVLSDGSRSGFDHPFGTLGYAANKATSGPTGDWMGMRSLSEPAIDSLAKAIVAEVKARGPFVSMADFVNRRPDSSDGAHRAVGALQAAIDKSGLNDRFTGGNRKLTAADLSALDGANLPNEEPVAARATGSAGYLSQAALLTALGSQITVRGDTFTIRAYGDHRDASDTIVATAWCEAVVQRAPEYVDQADDPEASEGWPSSSDTLNSVNAKFGRKFKIISFRWLNSDEV